MSLLIATLISFSSMATLIEDDTLIAKEAMKEINLARELKKKEEQQHMQSTHYEVTQKLNKKNNFELDNECEQRLPGSVYTSHNPRKLGADLVSIVVFCEKPQVSYEEELGEFPQCINE